MRSTKRSLLISTALVVPVALTSCGKKHKSSDDDGGTAEAPATTGVTPTTENQIAVSGNLALEGLSLADTQTGVLAFGLRGGELNGTPAEIAVDAKGNFTVPLVRADEAIDQLLALLQVPRDQRDWAKVLELAGKVTDVHGATVDSIKSMSDDELNEGIRDVAEQAKAHGNMTLLVAYEKSGNKVAEASSFRFIGLPTASGRNLSGIPNSDLIGNTQLGTISGAGVDVTSELGAASAFNLSAEAQDTLADLGSTLKAVKNRYMNDWRAEPFFVWYHHDTGHMSDAVDKFSDVTKSVYHGYGFYVASPDNATGFTYDGLCGGKTVTFTPPAAITVANNANDAHTVVAYDNTNASKQTQGDSRICTNDGYYAREDVRDGQTSFMLNFGTGGSITTSPEGLWRLNYDGTEVARFDLQAGSPMKDGKPLVFVPSAKFVRTGESITSVEVQLYRWTGSEFARVTDMGPVKKLVGTVNCSVTRASDNGESRVDLTIADDGTISGAFDGKQTQNGAAVNPAVAYADASDLACYYTIGTSNYRVDFRDGM